MPFSKDIPTYFGDRLSGITEPCMCIDSKLNILAATDAADRAFGLHGAKHLGCVFGEKYYSRLKNAVQADNPVAFSFYSPAVKANKKCFLSPFTHDGARFATVVFYDPEPETEPDDKTLEIRNASRRLERDSAALTTGIAQRLKALNGEVGKTDELAEVYRGVLTCRRDERSLSLLIAERACGDTRLIDLGDYVRFILEVAGELIGEERIGFSFSGDDEMLFARVDPFAFEIMMCKIITTAIDEAKSRAKLGISVYGEGGRNVVMVTGCTGLLVKGAQNTAASVVQKIAKESGGVLFTEQTPDGKGAFGLSLPCDKPRSSEELCTPENAGHDSRGNILIELSSAVSAGNILQ